MKPTPAPARAPRAFSPARILAAAALASAALVSGLAAAAPGDFDPAFGTGGKVSTNFSTTTPVFGEGRGVALQADGKLVVCGSSVEGTVTHFALLRYNPDGTQDASFGTGGIVRTFVGAFDLCNAVAIQPADQKIVAVGFNDANGNDFVVVRYLANGTLDSTFGAGGIATFDIAGTAAQDRANGVVALASGKILVTGWATMAGTGRDFATIRLNANGTLDNTFGCASPGSCSGKAITAITAATDRPYALAVDSQGRIVVVGDASGGQAAIARYGANGVLDTTFNGTGFRTQTLNNGATCYYGPSDKFRSVAILPGDKIIAAGDSYSNYHPDPLFGVQMGQMAFMQFNANGTPDATFGPGGATTCQDNGAYQFASVPNTQTGLVLANVFDGAPYPFNGGNSGGQSGARDVRVDSGGRIVGMGYADTNASGAFLLAAVRLNTNGTLDSTFGCVAGTGCTGKYATHLGPGNAQDNGAGGTLDASGLPVITGYHYPLDVSGNPLVDQAKVGLLRLTANGVPDATFSGDGIVLTQIFGGSNDSAGGIALQADGKVVMAGSTYNGSNTDFALARYTTAGALDTSFSGDGLFVHNAGANEVLTAATMGAGGTIIAAGQAGTDLAVVRLTSAGALDGTFGTGGIARAGFGGTGATAHAVALQPDGKVVAGGINYPGGTNDAVVVRFTSAGAADSGFGSAGKVTLNWGTGTFDEIHAVAVQPDGAIVVAGRTTAPPGGTYFKVALARLTAAGALDTTFGCPAGTGCSGKVITSVNTGSDEAYAIALQPDGKIVLAGKTNTVSGTNDFLALRFNANGTLDTTFGSGGSRIAAVRPSDNDSASGLAVRVDGKIVLFGSAFNGSNDDFAVVLLTRDGALDASFGTGGILLKPVNNGNDYANRMAIAANGDWVLGGQDAGPADFLLARMLAPAHEPFPIGLTPATDTGASNADGITKNNRPTVAGTCFHGESVTLRADGGAVASAVTCAANDTFSATPTGALADGVYAVTATAANANGTSTPTTPAYTVTIDTIALPPTIGVPAAAATVPVSTTISGGGAEAGAAVTVVEGAATVCTATADAGGAWTCPVTLAAGPHTIAVNQLDIAGNLSVDSATVSFVAKRVTTLAVGSSPNPSTYSGSVTITATISGGVSPGGTVQFRDGAADLGSPVAVSGGAASMTTAALGGGTHALSATYTGDATHFGATAPSVDHVVNRAPQTISFDAPAARTVYSGSFAVTASSNSSLPVAITSDTPAVCTIAAGMVSLLAVGDCTLAANQAGDANYLAATAVVRTFAVGKEATVATVSASANPANAGASVTLTAALTGTPPPTGTVTFLDGATTLGTGTLAGGTASFATSSLSTGDHSITAVYGGSAFHEAATSAALVLAVIEDTTPDPFHFEPTTLVHPGDVVVSAPVTITGLGAPATVTVAGGEYSVGCTGTFTENAGTISQGETVCLRHVAPLALDTRTTTTITIGGVAAVFQSLTWDTLDPARDTDRDGIPNGVEANEGTNPLAKDNDVFANARLFAMQQYRDFLAREGDPGGITGWTDAVQSGSFTRAQAIDFFVGTPEFQGFTGSLVRLYLATFGRLPDYAGLAFNLGVLRTGITMPDLAAFFIASPEGAATYGALDNAQFVTHLYQNVLGRAPDAPGLAGWTAFLDGGTYTRGQVMLGFSESTEYRAAVANDVFVTMMYAGMLRRTPDVPGLSGWVSLIEGGLPTTQVIDGFFLSTEYRARFLP